MTKAGEEKDHFDVCVTKHAYVIALAHVKPYHIYVLQQSLLLDNSPIVVS